MLTQQGASPRRRCSRVPEFPCPHSKQKKVCAKAMAALERPRRALAGRNISKLLDQEEVADEFYKTAYGGFSEEEEDREYQTEESEDDAVDSDFDASEEDEVMETEREAEEPKRKKKQWIKPARPQPERGEGIPKPKRPKPAFLPSTTPADPSEQRTFRRSTQQVSAEHQRRIREAKRRSRHTHRGQRPTQRRLTQQEMLEEAKWTELENRASLEMFTRLEEEKKQVKEKKRVVKGPFIRFHSVTMPVISEVEVPSQDPAPEHASSNSATENSAPNHTPSEQQPQPPQQQQQEQPQQPQKYCRNFLVFTDTSAYPSAYFPTEKPPKPKRLLCHLTGLPAKYIDPITGTPYATPHAFKIIRTRYVRSAEEKCEKRLLQLSSWLEEKKRKKQESRN